MMRSHKTSAGEGKSPNWNFSRPSRAEKMTSKKRDQCVDIDRKLRAFPEHVEVIKLIACFAECSLVQTREHRRTTNLYRHQSILTLLDKGDARSCLPPFVDLRIRPICGQGRGQWMVSAELVQWNLEYHQDDLARHVLKEKRR